MASTPPGDGSILPDGWTWSDIGHGALDVVGLVPLFGEAADVTNAAWYAAEGNYLDAGLSLISMVPVVGDVVGKGGRIAKKAGGKLAGPALDVLKKMDFKKTLEPFRTHPKISEYVDKIVDALETWRADLLGKAGADATAQGVYKCPHGAQPNSRVYSAVDPGPLDDSLAETFSGGRYREVITTEDIIVKRVGEKGKPLGQFYSTESAAGVAQARIDRGLPPVWQKTGQKSVIDTEYDVLIPKGTKMYVGEIGTQNGFYVGGTQQIVIPAPWKNPNVVSVGQRPLK
jgi:hypothetical protein